MGLSGISHLRNFICSILTQLQKICGFTVKCPRDSRGMLLVCGQQAAEFKSGWKIKHMALSPGLLFLSRGGKNLTGLLLLPSPLFSQIYSLLQPHLLLFTPRHCLNGSTPGHFAAPLPSRLRFWRISPAMAFPKWIHPSVCHHNSSPKAGVSEIHQMLWEN